MTFQADKCDEFQDFVTTIVDTIASFKGCHKVEILRDVNQRNIFFSYSLWDSEDDLNNYRHSEKFKEIWTKTKQMFSEKTIAWSTEKITNSH